MKIWILCVVVLIVIIFYLQEKKNYNRAPKIIWSYWQGPVSKTVEMCKKSWSIYNPDYQIIMMTDKTYHSYVTIPENIRSHPNFRDVPARFADLVRVWTLAEHGGVWMDASILVKAPLDSWMFPKYAEFSGFYRWVSTTNPQFPVIENWFFACNKGCKFLQLWRDEFSEIARFPSVSDYVESRKRAGVDVQEIHGPIYLAMHVSAQKVLQLDKYPQDQMILRVAELGPFRYMDETTWDSKKGLQLACQNKEYQAPMLKLCSAQRKALDEEIEGELSEERCGWLE